MPLKENIQIDSPFVLHQVLKTMPHLTAQLGHVSSNLFLLVSLMKPYLVLILSVCLA